MTRERVIKTLSALVVAVVGLGFVVLVGCFLYSVGFGAFRGFKVAAVVMPQIAGILGGLLGFAIVLGLAAAAVALFLSSIVVPIVVFLSEIIGDFVGIIRRRIAPLTKPVARFIRGCANVVLPRRTRRAWRRSWRAQ